MHKSNARLAIEISKDMYDMSSAFWRDTLVPIESQANSWFVELLSRLRSAEGNEKVVHFEVTEGEANKTFLIMAFRAGHFLQRRMLQANDIHRLRLVEHMQDFAKSSVGANAYQFVGRFDSRLYECAVFCRMANAGFDPEFIPTHSCDSPDIKTKAGILIECKNACSQKTGAHDLKSVVTWIGQQVRKSREQMREEDKNNEYVHVTCLDLAGGVFDILEHEWKNGSGEFARFWDEVFGMDTPETRMVDPLSVQFSSFDFGLHQSFEKGETYPEVRERWVRPMVIANVVVRLGGFLNEFWHSMGVAPFGHLHQDKSPDKERGEGEAPAP